MLVFVHQARNYEYREKLQIMERSIMKEHLYDERGSRKWSKEKLSNSMARSRVSIRMSKSRVSE